MKIISIENLRDLKNALNSLTEEQLNQKVLTGEEDKPMQTIEQITIAEEDCYADEETFLELSEIKKIYEGELLEEILNDERNPCYKAGTVFIDIGPAEVEMNEEEKQD